MGIIFILYAMVAMLVGAILLYAVMLYSISKIKIPDARFWVSVQIAAALGGLYALFSIIWFILPLALMPPSWAWYLIYAGISFYIFHLLMEHNYKTGLVKNIGIYILTYLLTAVCIAGIRFLLGAVAS